MKNVFAYASQFSCLLILLTGLSACGGIDAQKLSLNENVKLKKAEVKILNVEAAKSLSHNKDGSIVTAPKGKKFIILSYEGKKTDGSAIKGFRTGVYRNDTEDGIATETTEIPGVFSISRYLDAGYEYAITLEHNKLKKLQSIYMVDENAKGLKVRVGSEYGWDELYSIDIDSLNIKERKGAEVLAQMREVMKAMNGKADSVDKAVSKYLEPNAPTGDIGVWGLSNPQIIKFKRKNGIDYYKIRVKSGVTKRIFDMYWRNGKIAKIVDKGMVR